MRLERLNTAEFSYVSAFGNPNVELPVAGCPGVCQIRQLSWLGHARPGELR